MAAFSRLQLAAALLEYDNDPDNPDVPFRSAHESAIFCNLPRNPRPQVSRKSPDLLGVSLPSESEDFGDRESAAGDRRSRISRGSMDALRNPFGAEEYVEVDVEEEEDLEVDLASWGLDSFIPKEKGSKNSRNKSKLTPHPVPSLRSPKDATFQTGGHRTTASRSLSLGNVDNLGIGLLETPLPYHTDDSRRRSFASQLNPVDSEPSNYLATRRRASVAFVEGSSSTPPQLPVPFPTSPGSPELLFHEDARSSLLDPDFRMPRGRTQSAASMGSRMAFRDDLKAGHTRTTSNATMGTLASRPLLSGDNPFALEPPSFENTSKFDPKAVSHARTVSNASLGSRVLLDDDAVSGMTGYTRDRPISTIELLRPKVLVMPSPLQDVQSRNSSGPIISRDGFQFSTDGPPLPPEARANRRSSAMLSVADPSSRASQAFDSFTPNPRMSLTLSQLTFRNSLMVGGQRDVAYSDIDNVLPRAVEDGEQIYMDPPVEKENQPLIIRPNTEEPARPAGKLFGKSLIDDLESRKAHMRSKQRVFGGDDRPSMMARAQVQRSTTLIDPASLQTRPASQHMTSFGSQSSQEMLGRRNSVKPLLNFDDEKPSPVASGDRMPKSRSVFGVDTLWESEMAKLREIEAREAQERERRAAEEEARDIKKRNKRKGKSKAKAIDDTHDTANRPNTESRVSIEPPILPAIQKATASRPPPAIDDEDTESESEESDAAVPSRKPAGHINIDLGAEQWYDESSSSEEHDGPRRTTGTGPRYPNSARRPVHVQRNDDDSDEDVPLAATLGRAIQRSTYLGSTRLDSDDEEQSLAVLLDKTKRGIPSINFDRPLDLDLKPNDDDDDDKPLGLRISSRVFNSVSGGDDDDDKPLAFHPEQQRRTQYNMMAQQQQQMMQAQLQSSMFFGAPPMGSGFFSQPLAPPMMVGPFGSAPMVAPPLHDSGKFGRVDRWRHDVAVEGEH